MSADNVICVQQRGKKWYVWMEGMTQLVEGEVEIPKNHSVFDTWQLATAYAEGWLHGEMIVEYGIVTLEPVDPPRCPTCNQEIHHA